MTSLNPTQITNQFSPPKLLIASGRAWFGVAAIGQLAFIGFILVYYGTRTLAGDYAAWNDKQLIDGHIEGDPIGNLSFAAHVFIAAIMTLTGLLQLWPRLRRDAPRLHRYSGRVFLITACFLALSGLGLGLIRGTYLSYVSLVAISFNAVLILVFAGFTVRFAVQRQIAQHQIWAMRLFLVANGVWFLRVGMMGWLVLAQGPVGMTSTLSGPADIVLVFGCYLIPLAVYEIYRQAQQRQTALLTVPALCVMALATAFTALGVFGTIGFMWLPEL